MSVLKLTRMKNKRPPKRDYRTSKINYIKQTSTEETTSIN